MIAFAKPTSADLAEIREKIPKDLKPDDPLAQNYYFDATFNIAEGFYAPVYAGKKPANLWWYEKGQLCRLKTGMRRREWIETYVHILNEDKKIELLKLRSGQRALECLMLRMERLGLPIRIALLKSRKHGASSYIVATGMHESLRRKNCETLLVADTDERAEMLLSMATIGRTNIPAESGPWTLKMSSKAAHKIRWDAPIASLINIASAQREDPGIGTTPLIIHGSEVAVWADAIARAAALFNSIPMRPGTMAFMESTARGSWGLFYNTFIAGWEERHKSLENRTTSWASLFIAWYEHAEYRWTKTRGRGKQMTQEMIHEIATTLDPEEEWLLTQTYYRRWEPEDEWTVRPGNDGPVPCRVGVGPVHVDYDQLKWRRFKLKDPECGGDINLLHREYPSTQEEAWTASGNPVFDPQEIQRLTREVTPPIWVGELSAA